MAGMNLGTQNRNNTNTITRNSPTQQKAVINKKILQLALLFYVSELTQVVLYCNYKQNINQLRLILNYSIILDVSELSMLDHYQDNFQGQQCQFKCRTNLGCLRRLFRVTILEDEV
ncbi:Hypothetical_protein [Hexamita inflata]|uniref:Hypothetical_protein n=1 Tax=Hexamita inflata TaxID=28002 RepID=A0AA86VD76_9EUKA|nr:Hypothetical protein HINF_LOCUS50943 [Hexamita inflata]